MSTLKELYTDLKDRISNPSILSFTISWLILNYKIPIGLIFYKISDLDKYHNATYFSLISDETNIWHLIWIPLIVSAFYTLIFPFVKAGIRIFNSWLITKTDGAVFHYTKNHKISIEEHTARLFELQETKGQYVALIASEQTLTIQNNFLNERVVVLTTDYEQKISEINKANDVALDELRANEEQRRLALIGAHENRLYNLNLSLEDARNKILDLTQSSSEELAIVKKENIDYIAMIKNEYEEKLSLEAQSSQILLNKLKDEISSNEFELNSLKLDHKRLMNEYNNLQVSDAAIAPFISDSLKGE